MADINIKYRGVSIATMNATGRKTLGTQGKYCDSDIVVEYTIVVVVRVYVFIAYSSL